MDFILSMVLAPSGLLGVSRSYLVLFYSLAFFFFLNLQDGLQSMDIGMKQRMLLLRFKPIMIKLILMSKSKFRKLKIKFLLMKHPRMSPMLPCLIRSIVSEL